MKEEPQVELQEICSHSLSRNSENAVTCENLHKEPECDGGLKNPFGDKEVAKYWQRFYEESGYENRHLFDPAFYYTKAEVRKITLRKTDLHVCLFAFIMLFALNIDRFNLQNAVSDNFLSDLKLSTDDYNLGNTVNLVCFLGMELPSNLISKWIGPDIWIPTQMCLWSIVAIVQCRIKSRTGFLVTRCLIGAMEGGFIPDTILWMSYFYTGPELATRVGWLYTANPLTQAFSSLISYGIYSNLEGSNGWHGWQYVFLIEGLFSLLIGVLAFFLMSPSPSQTRAWYRPHGWYSPHEEKVIINHVLRDEPAKGTMNNRAPMGLKQIVRCILNYDLWPISIVRIFGDLQNRPLTNYMPVLLRRMGFSSVNTSLLMIPQNFLQIITLLAQIYGRRALNSYWIPMVIVPLWMLPCFAAMRWWPGFLKDHWGSYALLLLALGAPRVEALNVTWASHNSAGVGMRTVSGALTNVFSQLAGIIASQMFRADDSPYYRRGLTQLIAITIASFFTIALSCLYYYMRNCQKEKQWSGMTHKQQVDYLDRSEKDDTAKLDFRFTI